MINPKFLREAVPTEVFNNEMLVCAFSFKLVAALTSSCIPTIKINYTWHKSSSADSALIILRGGHSRREGMNQLMRKPLAVGQMLIIPTYYSLWPMSKYPPGVMRDDG